MRYYRLILASFGLCVSMSFGEDQAFHDHLFPCDTDISIYDQVLKRLIVEDFTRHAQCSMTFKDGDGESSFTLFRGNAQAGAPRFSIKAKKSGVGIYSFIAENRSLNPDELADLLASNDENIRIFDLAIDNELGSVIHKVLSKAILLSRYPHALKEEDFSVGLYAFSCRSKIKGLGAICGEGRMRESGIVGEIGTLGLDIIKYCQSGGRQKLRSSIVSRLAVLDAELEEVHRRTFVNSHDDKCSFSNAPDFEMIDD